MSQVRYLSKAVLASSLVLVLSACGTDTPTTGAPATTTTTTTTGTTTGGLTVTAGSSAAATAVITYPLLNAVQDDSWGYYRRKVAVMVQDKDGQHVADGTPVYLSLIDSVIATGTIDAVDSISGAVLSDVAPVDVTGVSVQFDGAYVIRNSAYRFIEEGDMVLAGLRPIYDPSDTSLGLAPEEDKIRFISGAVINNNDVTVTSAYTNAYPAAVAEPYAPGEVDYVIGASMLGASIAGETVTDEGMSLTPGVGYTKDGIANFRLTYPASLSTISTNCNNNSIDQRVFPVGSAKVYLAARVSDKVTAIDGRFCFEPTTGGSLVAKPASLSASGSVSIEVRDGGDRIRVPYWFVSASVEVTSNAGSLDVTATSGYTAGNGVFTSSIVVTGGASGDAATVTFDAFDTTVTVDIKIP